MTPNVSMADRTVRLVVGVLLAAIGLAVIGGLASLGPVVGAGALIVGAVLLVTGLTRQCPAYSLLGLNTAR